MSLNPFDPDRKLPTNPQLRKAIERIQESPDPAQRAALQGHLVAGPLLVAIKELPDGVGGNPAGLEGELAVRFVTAQSPGGETVIAAFTDPAAAAAKAPAGVWLALPPLALLRWIVDQGLDGLVLNPEGVSYYVSRDAVLKVLGLEGQEPSSRRTLSLRDDSENAVRDALEALLGAPGDASFLIVKEPRTGKFVRFSPEGDGSLMIDVPVAALAPDELQRAKVMFEELTGGADDLPAPDGEAAPEPLHLMAIFGGDAGRAAKVAIKMFTWVFGFPPGFELQIERH